MLFFNQYNLPMKSFKIKRKNHKHLFISVSLLALMVFSSGSFAQQKKSAFYGAGLSVGWYNPSLDYFQDESMFMEADFSGALMVNASVEFKLIKNLHGVAELGFWQETVEDDLQGYGNTKLLLTAYPLSLALKYYLLHTEASAILPYLGVGGDFLLIQNKLEFEDIDNPDPNTGSTMSGKAMAGIEAKVSTNFAIGLNFDYRIGQFKQDFNKTTSDPDNPEQQETIVVTEDVSLNGPSLGITFRYLF